MSSHSLEIPATKPGDVPSIVGYINDPDHGMVFYASSREGPFVSEFASTPDAAQALLNARYAEAPGAVECTPIYEGSVGRLIAGGVLLAMALLGLCIARGGA